MASTKKKNRKRVNVVAPSRTWEAEAGGSGLKESLCYIAICCFRNKQTKSDQRGKREFPFSKVN